MAKSLVYNSLVNYEPAIYSKVNKQTIVLVNGLSKRNNPVFPASDNNTKVYSVRDCDIVTIE